MKKTFIRDIKERALVTGPFLVTRKETGVSKTGKPYLNLKLMDSTGEIDARVWDDAEAIGRLFSKDDVVSVKAMAVAYQGGLQLNVTDAYAMKDGDYSIRDFLPASKRPPGEMMAELDRRIAAIGNRHVKALLAELFREADVRERFMTAPAAKSMHHPYLGGLIEHVLSMLGLVEKVAAHYNGLFDRDLVTAGAILHDIGKIYELSYKRSFDYTDEGRLLGHITMGVGLIDRTVDRLPGFPRELAVLIKHMVLAHHGHLEFGSPKRPKTLEALVLYYLDDLDAKVTAIRSLMEAGEATGDSWTPYQRIFERPIFKGTGGILEGIAGKEAPAALSGDTGGEVVSEGANGGAVRKGAPAGQGDELDLFK